MIGTPKEYDTKNKDLEDDQALEPEMKPITKDQIEEGEERAEEIDEMDKTFGQKAVKVSQKPCEAEELSDFIEVIIKIPRNM